MTDSSATKMVNISGPQVTKNFSYKELMCKCGCGKLEMDTNLLNKLQLLRDLCGFPLVITSGYRCPQHPEEAKKEQPGMHSKGLAVDIVKPQGEKAYTLLKLAIQVGFTGIGVSNKFIHLDIRDTPAVWGY